MHVVNVVSVAGAVSGAGTSGLYTASKHASSPLPIGHDRARAARHQRPHRAARLAETEGFPQRDVLPRHAHRFVIEADDIAEAIRVGRAQP
jgi:hypothetical protein